MDKVILDEILDDKISPKSFGDPVFDKLANVATKCWHKESSNKQLLKKLNNDLKVPENYRCIKAPILNEFIRKNNNIHLFCKRNDRTYFDAQESIVSALSALQQIADVCLEAERNHEVLNSKSIITKSIIIDSLTLLGSANSQTSFLRRGRLKPSLSNDVKTLCEQDNTNSDYLLGDDLVDSIYKAKKTYKMFKFLSTRSKIPCKNYNKNNNVSHGSSLNYQD